MNPSDAARQIVSGLTRNSPSLSADHVGKVLGWIAKIAPEVVSDRRAVAVCILQECIQRNVELVP